MNIRKELIPESPNEEKFPPAWLFAVVIAFGLGLVIYCIYNRVTNI